MSSDNIKERDWIATPSKDGQVYYFNKLTGQTQWEKPEELGSISLSANTGHFPKKNPIPPPKPRTMNKPPPRPKQSVIAKKAGLSELKIEMTMKPSIVKEMMFSNEQAGMRDPLNSDPSVCDKDPDTGFGGWEEVSPPGDDLVTEPVNLSDVDVLTAMKNEARLGRFGEDLIVQSNRSSELQPISFRSSNIPKKKPRRISSTE